MDIDYRLTTVKKGYLLNTYPLHRQSIQYIQYRLFEV